jgi:hypothetical protein
MFAEKETRDSLKIRSKRQHSSGNIRQPAQHEPGHYISNAQRHSGAIPTLLVPLTASTMPPASALRKSKYDRPATRNHHLFISAAATRPPSLGFNKHIPDRLALVATESRVIAVGEP